MTTSTEHLLDCGHPASPHSPVTTGYGEDDTGRRHCYACCQERELAQMTATGRLIGYPNKEERTVTDWPGSPLLTITHAGERAHNMGTCPRLLHVWAKDVTGRTWYGKGAGWGMATRLRRLAK